MEQLICSDPSCASGIAGTVAIISEPEEFRDEEEHMKWGNYFVYTTEKKTMLMLHPNCFKVFQDELLRQEQAAVLLVALGPVQDVRMALMM